MKLFIFIVALISSFNAFSFGENTLKNNVLMTPPPTVPFSSDTLIFDLKNAVLSVINGVSFIDLPIYSKAVNPISGFDFQMQFNQSKLTYVSTTKIVAQLDPLSYFNPNDSYLRNTTPGISSFYNVPVNTPLVYIRFRLATPCTQVIASDFFNVGLILNDTFARAVFSQPLSSSASSNLAPGLLCSSTSIPLNYPSTSSGRPIQTYEWDFGNGTSASTQNVSATYSDSGNYVISLVTKTQSGCIDTIRKNIVVQPSPYSDFLYNYDYAIDSMIFSNILLGGNSNLTFLWDFGDLSTSTLQDPKHRYDAGGSFSVSLTSNNSFGCSNKRTMSIAIDKPIANFTSSNNKCSGSSINFTNTSVYQSGTITSWLWDFGDNTPTSLLQNPTHIFQTVGTYTVTLIVSSSQGYESNISKTVIINDKPIVGFDANQFSGCSPLLVSFTDMSTADEGSTYLWDFGDYIISSLKNPDHSYLASRSYTVKEVVTSPGGCKDSLIKIGFIEILNSPITDFTSSKGCVNSVISFSNISTILTNTINSWEWSFGDNITSNLQHPTHVYPTSGSYLVTLKCTSNLGCSSTITKTVIINAKPFVQFTTTNLSGCTPLNSTFTDLSSTAIGSSYKWSFGDATSSSLQNPFHSYVSNGVFTVKEVVIAPGGCSDSLIKTDYISVLSAISSNFNFVNPCAKSSTEFTDVSTISSGTITSWNWNFGNGNSSTTQNPSFVYSIPGKYTVTITAISNLGCSNSFSKEVSIDARPKVNFSADLLSGCAPATIEFKNLSVAPDSSIYKWNFGDDSFLLGQDISHVYSGVNSFTVKYLVTSPQGCSDSLIKSDYITLKTPPTSSFVISTTTPFIPSASISFANMSNGAVDYYWDFGDDNYTSQFSPDHIYADSGDYEICLTASSSKFCSNKICDTIRILGSKKIAFPSAFSPNGDGKNDVFKLLGGPCKELNLKIFNQWGNLIFESNSQDLGWDGYNKGMLQPIGSYNYVVVGKTDDEKDINLFGVINLTK